MAMFNYRLSMLRNLRIIYRTNTTQPSVQQLQNVVDNSNSLQLSVGNPSLNQQYQHMFIVRYSATEVDKYSTFFVLFSSAVTDNYIANTTFISSSDTIISGVEIPAGIQVTRPVNLDGYMNTRFFVTYGIPVKQIKSNINVNGSITYSRIPGIINDVDNYSNSTHLSLSLVLSSNISDKIDFNVSSSSNYNIARNTIQSELDNDYFNLISRIKLDWIIWKGLILRTQYNHHLYKGLSEGFDQNYMIWNLGLGKKLFKNDRGEIRVTAYDLLNQNASIQRNVNDAYIEDVRTNVLQRFFMLSFTYNLRNFRI
jgi:hypothetical protein